MNKAKYLLVVILAASLWPGLAKAQTSINNNSGSSGLYSISSGSYYQNTGAQQQTLNVSQGVSNASILLKEGNIKVSVDPTSAPAAAKTEDKKSFGYYALLAYVIIGLAVLTFLIFLMGKYYRPNILIMKRANDSPEPLPDKTAASEITEEPEQDTPKTKPAKTKKTKRKKKKHHR